MENMKPEKAGTTWKAATVKKTEKADKINNKKLFQEMQAHLLEDDAPAAYLNRICDGGSLNGYPFSMLSRLKDIPQSPKHHPEGNVWNHTMLVVGAAAGKRDKSRDPAAFMWAALLHDIGKAETTRDEGGRITAYDHDKIGAQQAEEFLRIFLSGKDPAERELIRRIAALVRWHMQILFVVKSMRFADIDAMRKEADPEEVALLGWCDRMGRLNADRKAENENVKLFLSRCRERTE